ncbi:MocR-like pyridoxine biosynthesis transcription factor PdxR [Terrisporobacter sp.]
MLFSDLTINDDKPIYIQIKKYLEDMISKGLLPHNSKLPSTRELSLILNVSRNSIISAYDELKSQGIIYSISSKGTFVNSHNNITNGTWNIDYKDFENDYIKIANDMDIMKSEIRWRAGQISFKSISPDGELFDMEELKKSFLNRFNLEGHKLLNYGYAQGYKPLIDYLHKYMNKKGVDTTNKEILIVNGFTEGLNLIISALTNKGDYILCENPTHNTSIKIMKTHGINIIPVNINENGLDFDDLDNKLKIYKNKIKFSYITPSYHNPTGMVMSPENRYRYYNLMKKYNIPIIEDGFNEELLYSSSHIFPICSLDNNNNGVIYIGSFSKILFPGLRIGWILCDKNLVDRLESVKRCINIHVSFLDQGILYDYLQNGAFEKYIKKTRKFYGDKFNFAKQCVKKYIKCEHIIGDGGLHLFLVFKNINTRELLNRCYKKDVIFMPGDLFYIDDSGFNTLRLGLSRLSDKDIERGIRIIGETVDEMKLDNLN